MGLFHNKVRKHILESRISKIMCSGYSMIQCWAFTANITSLLLQRPIVSRYVANPHFSFLNIMIDRVLISPGETCWHNSRSILCGNRSLLSHPDLSTKSKPLWNWNHSLFTFPPRSWGYSWLAGCQGFFSFLFSSVITFACSDVEARQWSIGSTSNSRSK